MALFKNEMNWSSFQDKQLSALNSIGKVFADSMNKVSSHSQANMSKAEEAINSISNAAKSSSNSMDKFVGGTERANASMSFFSSGLGAAKDRLSSFSNTMQSAGKDVKKFTSELANSNIGQKVTAFVQTLSNQLGGLRGIGRDVDEWSKLSNAYIQNTGMSGKEIRAFRADMVSLISDLNKTTGYAYNPKESYSKLLAVTENITSDLDSINEMARPLLLASEGLNINIQSVADLFNRFYVRYSFSSSNMETVLNNIRENTAGNSATAEATMQNIEQLKPLLELYSGNDTKKIEEFMSVISEYTSYFEGMGVDSKQFTSWIESLIIGDYSGTSELIPILNAVGMDFSKAKDDLRTLDPEAARSTAEGLFEGIYNLMIPFVGELNKETGIREGGVSSLKAVSDNYNLDYRAVADIIAARDSDSSKSLAEFIESQEGKGIQNIDQQVEDKYFSMTEKLTTILEKIYQKLATLQEVNPLGFGLSDLAIGAMFLKSMKGAGGSGGSGGLGGAGGASASVIGTTLSKAGHALGTNLAMSGSAIVGNSASTGLALGAGAVGAAAGLGIAGYGGYNAYQNFKEGDYGTGAAYTGAGLAGLGGTAALLTGSGPVGWGLLAVGGIALLGTKIYEAAHTFGAAEAIEAAYDEASKNITKQAKSQENTLLDIKSNLLDYDERLDDGKKLQEQRDKLIQSGILSESDLKIAREANADELRKLTDAYIEATKEWENETNVMLTKYGKLDKQYAEDLQGNLEELLQEWNDGGKLEEGSAELEAVENLFYNLKDSLETRASAGETFDKNTQLIYDDLIKALSDGKLSKTEADMIIDEGWTNTTFQNANFGVEDLVKAVGVMKGTNTTGASAYNKITEGLVGPYYGVDNTTYVADIVGRLKSKNGVATIDEATKLLDELESKGFTSSIYPEIAEAAAVWGLSGYDEGSNYIEHDQLAVLHEGEAVVPKRYNPAVNSAEFETLASHVSQSNADNAEESRKNRETLALVATELREIKAFLSTWKSDNEKNSIISAAKSRTAASSAFISRFLET